MFSAEDFSDRQRNRLNIVAKKFPEKTITAESPSCQPFNFKLERGNFEIKMRIHMLWEVVIVIPKFQKRFPESGKSIEKAVSFTFQFTLLYCEAPFHQLSFAGLSYMATCYALTN